METHVGELQREKCDLETRLEEEQDVVEQLTTKQRHSITQIGSLQQQLTEANFQIEDLQGTKQTLESKVCLYIHPFISLSIHFLSIHPFIFLFIHLSLYPSIFSPSIHLSLYPSIYLSIHPLGK